MRKCFEVNGDQVRYERMRRRMSVTTLVRLSGLRPETLSRIENGHRDRVRWDTVERLARALCVPPALLVNDPSG